ncbi:MAG: tRNA pseudouridine(38-40) synthase TruA, partial [Bacteroidia bacterium]|nr:tRNA pseudouridine(38-40) synthase TruA [Bacteroidia bacterium]
MRRYVLWLAYEGTKYAGWQRQLNASTVAGTIEACLARLFGRQVNLVGAGRTDKGVHARMQVAHWDASEEIRLPFLGRLNSLLPGDIRALALYEGSADFHARHSALSRTYRYYIHQVPNPFLRAYSTYVPLPVFWDILQGAASHLVGKRDFSAFAKEVSRYKEPVCEVYRASWYMPQEGFCVFEIEANRFLRAMVRGLVGAQLRLAQKRISWSLFQAALEKQSREWGMHLAPPQGLFLWEVKYSPNSLSLLEGY